MAAENIENVLKLPAPDIAAAECILKNVDSKLMDVLKTKDQHVPLVELDTTGSVQEEYLKSLKSCVQEASAAELRGIAEGSFPGLLRVTAYNQIKSESETLEKLVASIHKERKDVKRECCVLSGLIRDIAATDKKADDLPETVNAARKAVVLRRQQISNFLDTQYVHPTTAEVRQFWSTFGERDTKNRSAQHFSTPDELLTSLLEKGSGDYVEAGSDVWPPHLELFLRSGVALRHPTKPDHVCLSPF